MKSSHLNNLLAFEIITCILLQTRFLTIENHYSQGMEGIKAYGIDKLIEIAASQLSDQLPESREAARTLAVELQAIYVNSQTSLNKDSAEPVDAESWEAFCLAKLTPSSAQAILRVTSSNQKEAPGLGC